MALTGKQIADKFKRNMVGAAKSIEDGVRGTTKSQTGNAIKQQDVMVANYNKAIADGKYRKGLEDAGDQKWADNLIKKGIPKIAQGIELNMPHIERQFEKVAHIGAQAKDAVDGMPKGGMSNALARVQRNMEMISDFWESV